MITKEEKLARMSVIKEALSDRNVAEVCRRLEVTTPWMCRILKLDEKDLPSEYMIMRLEDYLEIKRKKI